MYNSRGQWTVVRACASGDLACVMQIGECLSSLLYNMNLGTRGGVKDIGIRIFLMDVVAGRGLWLEQYISKQGSIHDQGM